MGNTTFLDETIDYISNARKFSKIDWIVYMAWVGLMLGLFFSVGGFLLVGRLNGAEFPFHAYNVLIGTAIFTVAISIDTIGHRTIYKEALTAGEALVHHMTIVSGVTSCMALCLCFTRPDIFAIPAYVLIAMSFFYTVIDEAMHWHRFYNGKSDRVEMWSHYFIILGHSIMILSWIMWFREGYQGVAQTTPHLF